MIGSGRRRDIVRSPEDRSTHGSAIDCPPMRLRLRSGADRPPLPLGDGPVVLVLPARDEAARIGAVIGGCPPTCSGDRPAASSSTTAAPTTPSRWRGRAGRSSSSTPRAAGLGAAVRTGLKAATGLDAAAVVFCDADGEYDPAEIAALVEPLAAGRADYVVGLAVHRDDRTHAAAPPARQPHAHARRCGSSPGAASPTARAATGALSARAAAECQIVHDYNYAQVLTLDALARGFRYEEVPITYSFREGGRSFVRLGRYLRAVVPAVWRVVQASPRGRPDPSTSTSARPR